MGPTNGWTSAKLCEVAKTATGGTPARKNRDYFDGVIPWVKSGELDDNIIYDTEEHLSEDAIRDSSAKVFPKGTVLVALYGATVGKTAILETEAATNQAICAVFVNDRVLDHRYLRYFLVHTRPDLLGQRYGGAQPNISQTIIRNTRIALPPLDEQRQIAAVLSGVQRAIERQERLIALTAELKKALMHKLFIEGARGEPLKQTEIGPVPESWEIDRLDRAGDVIYGIQAAVANNTKPVGTRILTNKNIDLDGNIIIEKQSYFELKTERHRKTVLKKGDILFNWRSGSKEHVGKTAFFDLEGEWTHSSFILRIRPREEVNGRFLFHFLSWLRESKYFVKLHSYAVNAKFNKSAINALPTVLPNRPEQDMIAAALDAVIRKVNVHAAGRAIWDRLFRTLLHQLMTAQIRVNDLDLSALAEAAPAATAV